MKKNAALCLTVILLVSMLLGCAGKMNPTQLPIPQASSSEPETSGIISATEFTVATVNSVEPGKDDRYIGTDIGQHRTIASADLSGSFAPVLQFQKREIHTVFPRFRTFELAQNLSLSSLSNYAVLP